MIKFVILIVEDEGLWSNQGRSFILLDEYTYRGSTAAVKAFSSRLLDTDSLAKVREGKQDGCQDDFLNWG